MVTLVAYFWEDEVTKCFSLMCLMLLICKMWISVEYVYSIIRELCLNRCLYFLVGGGGLTLTARSYVGSIRRRGNPKGFRSFECFVGELLSRF